MDTQMLRMASAASVEADSDAVVAHIIADTFAAAPGFPGGGPRAAAACDAAERAAREARAALASSPDRAFCVWWAAWWRDARAHAERAEPADSAGIGEGNLPAC